MRRLRDPVAPHPYRCHLCAGRHPANRCRLACRRCGSRLVAARDLALSYCRSPGCVQALHAHVHDDA